MLVHLEIFFFVVAVLPVAGAQSARKKKDIRDYTDADLERLYEQWEVSSGTKAVIASSVLPVNLEQYNRTCISSLLEQSESKRN